MISLTYLSTATTAFSERELATLLAVTRPRNHGAGLTGMLLHAGGHFIQTLEGEEADVDATFARIERDPRHRDLIIALREEIEERHFPDWSMGFESLTLEEASDLPGFSEYLDAGRLPCESAERLGRAGVFHRVFRDKMR